MVDAGETADGVFAREAWGHTRVAVSSVSVSVLICSTGWLAGAWVRSAHKHIGGALYADYCGESVGAGETSRWARLTDRGSCDVGSVLICAFRASN